MNVDLPIFSIHGNHDDPAGDGHFAALDLLSCNSLVNYFGQQEDFNKVEIKPLLFRKGESNVAVYGLGNIRDERLHTTWEKNQVTFVEPAKLDWFNIFVLHQNRAHHSAKSYVDANKIPDKMDLVVWGHEHECLVQLENNAQGFAITQPGSSVVTSFNQGESNAKHVALLEISKTKYRLVPIKLRSTRPYIFSQVVLKDTVDESGLDPKDSKLEDAVSAYLESKVVEMMEQAKEEYPHHYTRNADPKKALPLIRLRVDWTGFCTVNRQRFGAQFVGKVANPSEILQFMKSQTKKEGKKAKDDDDDYDGEGWDGLLQGDAQDGKADIVDMVSLDEDLKVLPQMELRDAVTLYVDKEDNDAIKNFVDKTLKETQESIRREHKAVQEAEEDGTQLEVIDNLVKKRRDDANMKVKVRRETEMSEAAAEGDDDAGPSAPPRHVPESDEELEEEDGDGFAKPAPKKALAPGRNKAVVSKQSKLDFGKAKPTTRGKRKKAETESEDDEEVFSDENSEEERPVTKKRKAPAKKAPARAKAKKPEPVEVETHRSQRSQRGTQQQVIDLDSDDDDDQSVQGLSVKSYATTSTAKKWGSRR